MAFLFFFFKFENGKMIIFFLNLFIICETVLSGSNQTGVLRDLARTGWVMNGVVLFSFEGRWGPFISDIAQ